MSRKVAREQAFKVLFAMDIGENSTDEALEIVKIKPLKKRQESFILQEVEGVLKNIGRIDALINKFSSDWDVKRLPAVDRSILRLSLYEILFCDDIPTSVSINEAVELAKKFSDALSYKFINGLLGSVAREMGR